jgi:hypothetical protein
VTSAGLISLPVGLSTIGALSAIGTESIIEGSDVRRYLRVQTASWTQVSI